MNRTTVNFLLGSLIVAIMSVTMCLPSVFSRLGVLAGIATIAGVSFYLARRTVVTSPIGFNNADGAFYGELVGTTLTKVNAEVVLADVNRYALDKMSEALAHQKGETTTEERIRERLRADVEREVRDEIAAEQLEAEQAAADAQKKADEEVEKAKAELARQRREAKARKAARKAKVAERQREIDAAVKAALAEQAKAPTVETVATSPAAGSVEAKPTNRRQSKIVASAESPHCKMCKQPHSTEAPLQLVTIDNGAGTEQVYVHGPGNPANCYELMESVIVSSDARKKTKKPTKIGA